MLCNQKETNKIIPFVRVLITWHLEYFNSFITLYDMIYDMIRVVIRVIGSVSNGYHSVRLYFGSIIFRIRAMTGHTRVVRLVTVRLKINYSSYQVSIVSVSIEVRVECQSVSGCHRLIIGSILLGTYWVQVFFK